MADSYTPPFDKYGMKAPEPVAAETAKAGPAASRGGYTPPWKKYGMSDPLSTEPIKDESEVIAQDTEQKFIDETANPKAPTLSWFEQVGRAAFFDVGDLITAKLVQRQLQAENPNLTYEQTLKMVRGVLEAEQSTSADVAGSLAPGLGVAKGVMATARLAAPAVAKAGMTKGAMRWAARNPKLASVVATAAEGAGSAAAFEALRASTENAIETTAGTPEAMESVIDATLTGGLVGGLLAPPVQGAARMAGGVVMGAVNYIGRALGAPGPSAAQATQRILKSVAASRPGEAPEATLENLRGKVMAFVEVNGRPPALAEILPPEIVEDVAGIMRHYRGLDQVARDASDEQIDTVVRSFDDFLAAGAKLKDTSTIKRQASRMFNSLMRRYGNTQVSVPDDTLDVLARNTDWLEQQAKAGNESAKAIKGVVEARAGIGTLRAKFADLGKRKNVAVLRQEVADLQARLATIINDRVNGGAVEASEEASLAALIKYKDAMTNAIAKADETGRASFRVEELASTLRNVEMILDRYTRDGLKVRLSDANFLRSTASSHAFSEADAGKRDIARAINSAVSQIGKVELPRYAAVVDMFSKAMTRSESQAAGRAAVRGSASAENLGVMTESGRTLGGKSVGPARLTAVQKGAQEGAKLELRDAARGTRREIAATAGKIKDSREIQDSIRAVAPKEADAIIQRSTQVSKSIESLEALASVKSPSSLSADQQKSKMVLEGLVAYRLGGAALAQLGSWLFTRARIPRGTAVKVIEMLADPEQSEKALAYMVRQKVNMAGFVGAVVAELERTSR